VNLVVVVEEAPTVMYMSSYVPIQNMNQGPDDRDADIIMITYRYASRC